MSADAPAYGEARPGRKSWLKEHVPRRHRTPGRLLQLAGMSLLALSAVFPLFYMLTGAFRSQDAWNHAQVGLPTTSSLAAFRGVWQAAELGVYLRNSAVVTGLTVLLSLAVASMAGYSFSKVGWRGSRTLYLFVLVWFAVAPVALIVPVYVEMSQLNLINTYWSAILFYAALNTPFNTYLMASFFRALPDELIEAGRMDGAGVHTVFLKILLPLSKPALATLCIFNFLFVWNEFVFALLLLQSDHVRTATVGVLSLQGRYTINDPMITAGLLIVSLPVIGIYLFFQKYLVRAIVAGAVK
jgi:ABC-type glycerol-3-phosphate transport system permease component